MIHFPRWKKTFVSIVCLLGLLYAAPNFLSEENALSLQSVLPDSFPGKQISLGLDLRGGAYLLAEVQLDEVIAERLENAVDPARRALIKAKIGYAPPPRVVDGAIRSGIRDPDRVAEAMALLRAIDSAMTVEEGEGGAFTIRFTEQGITDLKRAAMGQSIEIVRKRIDATGTREPVIQRQGDDRILIQLPGVKDPERIKDLLKQTAKLTFRFIDDSMSVETARTTQVPPGSEILPGKDGFAQWYLVKKRVMVAGENLVDAQPSFDQNNAPAVSFRFDTEGGRKFGKATSENVGRLFAIVLDNKVISAPRIQTAIRGGSGIITGNFTTQSASDLALLLRAGALPASIEYLEERTVGPGLGHDSIEAGKIAGIIGLVLVVIFMVVTYGMFGALADIALFFNVVLIMAVLSLLQATLTLPGIAGIVLTMGMAVDANVLVFERIREETRAGRTPISAIDAGYKRAMTTIIDSNLTTLIAAVLLITFGSGPIKGFAVTLGIGLVTSFFTAMMVTRMMVIIWLRRRKPQTLPV
jgi:preprotein translocase subunit SecD